MIFLHFILAGIKMKLGKILDFMRFPDRKKGTVYHMVLRHPATNVVYLEKKWVSWYSLLVWFLSKNETYIVVYFIGISKCGL